MTQRFMRPKEIRTQIEQEKSIQNPFNNESQRESYILFEQLCEAISDFMVKKYPDYANDLDRRIKEIEIHFSLCVENMRNMIQTATSNITSTVNEFLKKEYPELDRGIILRYEDLEKQVKKKDKILKEIEEKLSKITECNSLYEDVYKMRDEFKTVRKTVDDFSERMRKCFNILNREK